ncbi:MAG: glycosyltransferase family 8 protein [Pseudodesulfovibrio sp.]|nr:glycosyltransferase family 8 protein [Pseudodesulfovibrio sp.]
MTRKIPLAFCLNRNFLLLLKVALDSLLRSANTETHYDVYVIADDLTQEDIVSLKAIAAPYANSCNLIYRPIDNNLFTNNGFDPKNGSFSYYYRLAIPSLIPEYSKILYSDADVLFFGDLGKYYDMDLGDKFLGVVQFDHPSYFTADYDFDTKYFASGNLLMNLDACREFDLLGKISKVAQKYQGQLRHHDQDCLNAVFYEQVAYLPLNFCVNHKLHQDIDRGRYFNVHLRNYDKEAIWDAINNPDIVHYTGPKPDKASPSCKVWQKACAKAGLIDEYIDSVIKERSK